MVELLVELIELIGFAISSRNKYPPLSIDNSDSHKAKPEDYKYAAVTRRLKREIYCCANRTIGQAAQKGHPGGTAGIYYVC